MAFPSFVLCAVALLVASSSAAPGSNKVAIKIPAECKDKEGFCSIKPEGYDEIEEKINKLLPPFLINLGDRIGTSPDTVEIETDEDNCPSRKTKTSVYTRKYGRGNETKIDIFVNTEQFPQTIEQVNCVHKEIESNGLREDGPQCFRQLGLGMDYNMQFSCQESTATQSLLVYDPDTDTIKLKPYTIPVCCSCQITTV